ncbi:FkbM family methyltransferase [Candidatus Bathyarchaeota archaeon]|nr:FkbM family methyltransferase [Candidatus Bathyarchaeota archaeon]
MKPLNNGCFVDAGANFEVWTFFVARVGYEDYAFEPSPRPYRFLTENALPNVHVFNVALGDVEGEAELKLHERSEYDSLIYENVGFSGKTVKVKVRTLDSFKLESIGLIKIDTEGFELPVLLGARETIFKMEAAHCSRGP